MAMNKVLVVGGTGFIGKALVSHLREEGYEPLIFSRDGSQLMANRINPDTDGLIPAEVVANLDGIVNLAGENIGQRWSPAIKDKILASRVDTTQRIVAALRRNRQRGLAVPGVLINASAVGYYQRRSLDSQTEDSPPGEGFLAEVCRQWEEAALAAAAEGVRVAVLRFGIVLGPDGGVLSQMARPFRWGVGGVIGSGRQYLSWIHRKDLVRAVALVLGRTDMAGPYNLTSSGPVPMAEFMRSLGKVLGSPSWTKMPDFMARLALGEMADELLLADQRVVPKRLIEQGFVFSFPEITPALAEIYRR
ncbi:MAG: TIGR01777 family oxidoreductase [Negativicutes bacterium]|nr:TIGR01777 family oxidoreductase [Negativicutes bacterium]